jgi:hypothetical protein
MMEFLIATFRSLIFIVSSGKETSEATLKKPWFILKYMSQNTLMMYFPIPSKSAVSAEKMYWTYV